MKNFCRVLRLLLVLRLLVLIVAAFLPLGPPDVWRQSDTLGVALRYWLRWSVESGYSAQYPLLPAALMSGDARAIQAMEFPLLNLIAAPFFALGPSTGAVLARIAVALMAFGLAFVNARVWRDKRVAGVLAEPAMLLLPIFSFGMAWSGKFMPDMISVLLVTLAVGSSWEKKVAFVPALLAALGLLMKPTSLVVVLLLFLQKGGWKQRLFPLIWIGFGVAFTLLYYTVGVQWLKSLHDSQEFFAIDIRSPLQGLRDLVAEPVLLGNVFFYRAFFPAGVFLVCAFYCSRVLRERDWAGVPLLGVAAAQVSAIVLLDGAHAYIHQYYFIGAGVACSLAAVDLWSRARPRWVRLALALGALVPLIEICAMDVRALYKPPESIWSTSKQCGDLRARHPEVPWGKGLAFRSHSEPYPALGLCFGERQGSVSAEWGFFWKDKELPRGCTLVDQEADLVLARCS